MKNILVLGAGIYQVPLIKKIKEMGYNSIVCSIDGNYPGFKYADKIYKVDTTDINACLDIAKKESICGICTSGTDVALPSIGFICDKLNLHGISYKTALLCTDKKLMKEAFEEFNVNTPKFRICKNLNDINIHALELNFPLILKITDSSGSRGIEKINDTNDLFNAYNRITKLTRKPYVILEEFIEGKEFGAQVLVVNGNIKFCMLHGDILYESYTNVPIGHYVPYGFENKEKVILELSKSIRALNIKNAVLNVDMIEHNNNIYIIEIGARAGATCLPELVSYHYGIDFYKLIVNLSINEPINEIFDQNNACAAFLLYSNKDGIIQNIDITKARKNKNLLDLSIDYEIGDKVNKFSVGPDRIGQYIISGNNLDEIFSNNKSILNLIKIDIR